MFSKPRHVRNERQLSDNLCQRSRSDSLPRRRRFIPGRNAIYLLIISNPSKADVRLVSCSHFFLFDRRTSDALVWFSENAWFRGSDRLSAIVYYHPFIFAGKNSISETAGKSTKNHIPEAFVSQFLNDMKYAIIIKKWQKSVEYIVEEHRKLNNIFHLSPNTCVWSHELSLIINMPKRVK